MFSFYPFSSICLAVKCHFSVPDLLCGLIAAAWPFVADGKTWGCFMDFSSIDKALHVRVPPVTRTCSTRYTNVFRALHVRVPLSLIRHSGFYGGLSGLPLSEKPVIAYKVLLPYSVVGLKILVQFR